jgi:hypothetical protein
MREEAEYWFKEAWSNCGVSGSKPVLTTALISVMLSLPLALSLSITLNAMPNTPGSVDAPNPINKPTTWPVTHGLTNTKPIDNPYQGQNICMEVP